VINNYLATLPGKLSAIIVGHTHFDHALEIPFFATRSDCKILGSRSLDTLLTIYGMPNRVKEWEGDAVELSTGIKAALIPSAHGLVLFRRISYPGEIQPEFKPPLKTSEYRVGTVFMPKLKINGVTFLHAGSANFIEKEVTGHQCDVLFMCVAGWKQSFAYTNRFIDMVTPKVIVPIHFDDFSVPITPGKQPPNLPLQDMKGFLKTISSHFPDIEIILPKIFKPITF